MAFVTKLYAIPLNFSGANPKVSLLRKPRDLLVFVHMLSMASF